MAIIKVTRGGRSLKKAIDYVAKKAEIVSGVNCPDDRHEALSQMKITKEIYGKTDGRQYKSYVMSFSPKEVTPETAHRLGREWAERNFSGYEVLLGTHTDKRHIHTHVIVNSVNFENGKKIHLSKKDLETFKDVCDELCRREGLSVPERGKTAKGEVRAYDMAKYQLLQRVNNGENVKSYVLNAALAVNNCLERSGSKQEFLQSMSGLGYAVDWQTQRKNITLTCPDGHKVRMSNLEKTFSEPKFSKEGLEFEFEQLSQKRQQIQTRGHTRGAEPIICNQSSSATTVSHRSREGNGDGKYFAQTDISRVQQQIHDVKERTRRIITSDEPNLNQNGQQNRSSTRGQRDFGR